MQIEINHDLSELNQHLTALYQRLNGDLTPLMKAIGAILENSTRERFSTKKSPDGVAWENLLPDTVKAKGNNNILVDKGDLMKSITHHANADSVVVGSDRHYAKYHQSGGVNNLVARPFLGLSIDDKSTINELIESFIHGDL